jgi:bifunctional DNA-binding transcriptional regulator/antitoxin component of YhaV-PrlF toxin-antitoxin module
LESVKTIVPENGQVNLPDAVRQQLALKPGQTLVWEQLSPTEYSIRLDLLDEELIQPDPFAAIGFAQKYGLADGTTDEWMKILREGEEE